jgi:FkbM family methyltransferase
VPCADLPKVTSLRAHHQVMLTMLRKRIIARLLHSYPFLSGCGTIANSKWLNLVAGESTEKVWTKLENGLSIQASLADFDGRATFYAGDTDRKVTQLFKLILRPGDTVLDIGANIGLTMLRAAHWVGKAGQVHAFEPNPQMQQQLKESIAYNQLSNVTLHRVALGDQPGTLELNVPLGHSGAGSLVRKDSDPSKFESVQVAVKTLDSIFPVMGHIRLVKIDVEGFEPQVLRGAHQLCSRNPPDAMLIELNGYTDSIEVHPTIQILRELGYRLLGVEKSYISLKVIELRPGQSAFNGNDVLALRPGEVFESITAQIPKVILSAEPVAVAVS